jgi:hypothetical protein
MLDPLTALGLASNIVQLIQFTSDLVAKGRDIYQSPDGALVENLELEAITKSLQELSLELALPGGALLHLTKVERQLQQLCGGCRKVTDDLLVVIQKLKTQSPRKKWNSFRQALSSLWGEDEIQALSIRLERYRRQIDTTWLLSLRETLQSMRTVPGQSHGRAGQRVLGSVDESKQWQVDFIDALQRQGWQFQSENDIGTFSSRLSAGAKEEREQLARLRILERLRFHSMNDRYEKLEEAYEKTFDWVLQEDGNQDVSLSATVSREAHDEDSADCAEQENPRAIVKWDSFTQWLHSEQSLYWITGKPGSGKSTLMKYLYDDPRTPENLKLWAKGHQLAMSGFFFWNSGSSMQMSKMGLLQSLIYEIIKDDLRSIPQLFPDRWRSYELFGIDLHPWSWAELFLAFKQIISNNSKRFLFFIDGLDEFDGDTAELTQFVLEISSSGPHVKLCVASRPWLVFEDAFQDQPSLRIQDLTEGDIKLYVSEVLGGNALFANLQRIQPHQAEQLVIEITEKSSGVFLWVRLVVLSLLEGLQDGDTITNLQSRLLQLPSGLEELFQKILNHLNPSYVEEAYRIFQLVRAASEPLSLLSLSFAEEGFEQCMSAPLKVDTKEEIAYRSETMRRRLNSRCKGLLEAPTAETLGPEATVQYLHRTVKDFLGRPDIWEDILPRTKNLFDPDITLSGAFLRYVKSTKPRVGGFGIFFLAMIACIEYSQRIEAKAKDFHIAILNELERAASAALHAGPKPSQLFDWQVSEWQVQRSLETREKFIGEDDPRWIATQKLVKTFTSIPFTDTSAFFVYAFEYPLYTYVQYKLSGSQSPKTKMDDFSILVMAVAAMDLKMMQLVLDSGANPNTPKENTTWTSWHHVLRSARNDGLRIRDKYWWWAETVKLFLEHGANPLVEVEHTTAEVLIKETFHTWDPKWTRETLSRLAALKKSQKASKRYSHAVRGFFKKGGSKN